MSERLWPRYQFMGLTRFRIELLGSGSACDKRVLGQGSLPCLCCEALVQVHPYEAHATFRIGRELVGVVCPTCLAPTTRERLAHLRTRATTS